MFHKTSFYTLFLSICFLFPNIIAAQTPVPATKPAAVPSAVSAIDTTDFTTPNGLKVIHRRVTGNEVVATRVYFRGGSRNINEKNAGIETLLWEVA